MTIAGRHRGRLRPGRWPDRLAPLRRFNIGAGCEPHRRKHCTQPRLPQFITYPCRGNVGRMNQRFGNIEIALLRMIVADAKPARDDRRARVKPARHRRHHAGINGKRHRDRFERRPELIHRQRGIIPQAPHARVVGIFGIDHPGQLVGIIIRERHHREHFAGVHIQHQACGGLCLKI